MRILIVTQMWPSAEAPELGAFLVPMRDELQRLGHEVSVASLSRVGGSPLKYLGLMRDAASAARSFRPDVVFAHFLFPAGFAGLLASAAVRAPLVVMAHGQDVANLDRVAIRVVTAPVLGGAAAVIANSSWLAARLRARFSRARPEVVDLGVDLSQFSPDVAPASWPGDAPRFLCVGALSERKNVLALADAFASMGRGSLVFVGDGPLRGELEGRAGVSVVGRVPHAEVPGWVAACDVLCQPSLMEPFGLATLEAMAMERSVVATREGGPPEFVTPEAGVLVDPRDAGALVAALDAAAALPRPNVAARAAAAEHDVKKTTARMAEILLAATRARR